MRIEHLIHQSFETTHPHAGIDSIGKRLRDNSFLVVLDKGFFSGILTPSDIIESPHRLVMDCLHDKPRVGFEQDIQSVLALMKEGRDSVLPVFKGDEFIGVVTQVAVTDYFSEYHDEMTRAISEHSAELAKANEQLKQEIEVRKRAEEALRESEERYRTIFELAADSIVLVDGETGELVEFNKSAHESLGFTHEEFEKLKIPDFEVIETVEEVAKHIKNIIKEGTDSFETKHRTQSGEIRDIQVSSSAISIRGKNFIQSIWRDITEQRQAEETLRRARDQLELRVEERTAELANANENLKQEMEGHKLAEEALLEREKELEIKRANLKEANTALKVLLTRRDEDRVQLEEKVLSNINQLIRPYIEKLKKGELDSRQGAYVDVLESNLEEVISPFSRSLSRSFLNFSPTEIQVSNLIKHGKSTKAIAQLLNVSERTIDSHRESIRRKLGLKRKKTNLRAYLLSIQ
jgi:PAS domain S-box-containing protein